MEITLEKVDQVRERTGVSYAKAKEALEQMGLAPTIRGERLSLEEFARLSDILSAMRKA